MDAKDTWPVVKFIIAATGFKRRDARKLLEEIPTEHYSRLFLEARAWDRETSNKAGAVLAQMLGGDDLKTLRDATMKARIPAGADDGDEPEEEEQPRKTRKTTNVRAARR